jgi:hypothetical protein
MLRYVFALWHNALTLLRSVIASIIYRSGHIDALIASYGYCSELIGQRYCLFVLAFILLCISSPLPMSKELNEDLITFRKIRF